MIYTDHMYIRYNNNEHHNNYYVVILILKSVSHIRIPSSIDHQLLSQIFQEAYGTYGNSLPAVSYAKHTSNPTLNRNELCEEIPVYIDEAYGFP
jgi:hypothetical protein